MARPAREPAGPARPCVGSQFRPAANLATRDGGPTGDHGPTTLGDGKGRQEWGGQEGKAGKGWTSHDSHTIDKEITAF